MIKDVCPSVVWSERISEGNALVCVVRMTESDMLSVEYGVSGNEDVVSVLCVLDWWVVGS